MSSYDGQGVLVQAKRQDVAFLSLLAPSPARIKTYLCGNNNRGGSSMNYDDQMKNRVKRIEGQLRGILRMMEENKDCKDVIIQLSAARTAIDRTIGVVVSSNLVECVQKATESGEASTEELVNEAVNLLVKSR